jgi:cytoskeleton protein RodZ
VNAEQNAGPGKRLKAAREAMEVSAREVADALNLPLRVITALESDDYERLPPSVFTRGYVRSYARLLELSPDEILALYPEVDIEPEPPLEPPPVGPLEESRAKQLGLGIFLVVVLIAVVAWLVSGGDDAPATPEAVSSTIEQDAAQPGAAIPPREAEQAVRAPAEPADDSAAGSTADAVEVESPAEPAVAAPAADAAPVESDAASADVFPAEPGVRRITEFGDERLTFHFEQDCWVEVKSRDGENLYSDLNRAGRTLELVGRAPFRILLGYAPGVALEFNGEPVALAPHTRNNVANLVLGADGDALQP